MTLTQLHHTGSGPDTSGAGAGAAGRVTPGQVLARAMQVAAARRAAGAEELALACEWADAHPLLEDEPHAGTCSRAARRARDAARLAERRRIAADWLAEHEPDTAGPYLDVLGSDDVLPDPWLPDYAWDAVASFAAALGLSTRAGTRMIDEALFLRHRMPRLWDRVLTGEVEAFRARRIAQTGWRQPADVVDALDREATPRAHTLGITALDNLVDEITLRLHAETRELDQLADLDHCHLTVHHDHVSHTGLVDGTFTADLADAHALDRACSAVAAALLVQQQAAGMPVPESLDVRRSRALGILADPAHAQALLDDPAGFDPASLDPDRPLAPRLELVIHLTPTLVAALGGSGSELSLGAHPTALVTRGAGGTLRAQLTQTIAAWAGRPATQVTVQPVLDLTTHSASSSPEVTAAMKRRTSRRHPACVFPHCSRSSTACDVDHRIPADDGGATFDCNLHPLCRRHHRLKTFTGWTYLPLPSDTGPPTDQTATYLWTDPHGMVFLVDHHGTRNLTPDSWNGCRHTGDPESRSEISA